MDNAVVTRSAKRLKLLENICWVAAYTLLLGRESKWGIVPLIAAVALFIDSSRRADEATRRQIRERFIMGAYILGGSTLIVALVWGMSVLVGANRP